MTSMSYSNYSITQSRCQHTNTHTHTHTQKQSIQLATYFGVTKSLMLDSYSVLTEKLA